MNAQSFAQPPEAPACAGAQVFDIRHFETKYMEQNINKKVIFDTVRSMLGRGFAQAEVAALDRAIDAATLPVRPRLGALSERFESGGRGPGAVSSTPGDPGGASYGVWQLSCRAGTVAAFLASEGLGWRADFGEARPGSTAFDDAWRSVAERDPDRFAQAQHAFVERTHYRPAVAAVAAKTGLDLDSRHPAVRDASWSVAVQHGGAAGILTPAVVAADALRPRADAAYDRRLVEAIYAQRTAYVARLARRSGPAAKRLLESVLEHRYPDELAAALAMFEDGLVSV
jgi:hypothetical protein